MVEGLSSVFESPLGRMVSDLAEAAGTPAPRFVRLVEYLTSWLRPWVQNAGIPQCVYVVQVPKLVVRCAAKRMGGRTYCHWCWDCAFELVNVIFWFLRREDLSYVSITSGDHRCPELMSSPEVPHQNEQDCQHSNSAYGCAGYDARRDMSCLRNTVATLRFGS
jgi:hypothetical protein